MAGSSTSFFLKRTSDDVPLSLTREHETIAEPRKGHIDWASFDRTVYSERDLDEAANLWKTRAVQEMHSLALFTDLSALLQKNGAPLDWSGAFARMIADEVRHTDLCLRMCEALGRPTTSEVDSQALGWSGSARSAVIWAFCIGETISGRMFKRALHHTNVPLAEQVVRSIVIDETFHGELGWELGALLMRDVGEERNVLANELPRAFSHYARLCLATQPPAIVRSEPESNPGPNFGTLSNAGYARAFFDGMEGDVVPGLVAIGFPEAQSAYDQLLLTIG